MNSISPSHLPSHLPSHPTNYHLSCLTIEDKMVETLQSDGEESDEDEDEMMGGGYGGGRSSSHLNQQQQLTSQGRSNNPRKLSERDER